MTISELLQTSAAYLKEKGSATPRLDAELLLAEVLGASRIELYTNFDKPLTSGEVDHYRELIRRRAALEPVAYILGRSYFRNLTLKVNRAVLVPRPETEIVVDAALSFLMEKDWQRPPRVLDLGTGSGAIAISVLAGFPQADVTAVDLSGEALSLAEENARTAGFNGNIEFAMSDFFERLDPMETFDLIISNPPYISEEEWPQLPPDVRDFEPRQALYGGLDGLDCFRRLAAEAPQFLRPGGCLVVEIGYRQGDPVRELFAGAAMFGHVDIEQDYAGNDRVAIACRDEAA